MAPTFTILSGAPKRIALAYDVEAAIVRITRDTDLVRSLVEPVLRARDSLWSTHQNITEEDEARFISEQTGLPVESVIRVVLADLDYCALTGLKSIYAVDAYAEWADDFLDARAEEV